MDGPRLIVPLKVDGNKVMGGGDLDLVCAADHAGLGTNFFLLGNIAANGTLTQVTRGDLLRTIRDCGHL